MIWNKPFFEKKEMQKEIKMLQALREERGAILVLTALLLPFLFGCVGIGYDVGTLYMHKARLQNVADAAALAGARAYLDSQTNEDGTEAAENAKDHIDENAGTGRDKEIYQLSDTNKTKDRTTSAHKKADEAADAYIYKNIVNLGGKVKSDEYSHYALQDENGVKYYRIGLEERVPLAFLPVITNTYERRVRAGAIALLSEGTPATVITQGWSLFDKLFTVATSLEMTGGVVTQPDDHAIETTSSITSTFDGDMVFANENWTENAYWSQGKKGFYLFTAEEATEQTKETVYTIHNLELIPNTGSRMVQDTSIGITDYVEGFEKKLGRIHFDLQQNNGTFNISDIDTKLSYPQEPLYSVGTGDNVIYVHKVNNTNDYHDHANYYMNYQNNYYKLYREVLPISFPKPDYSWISTSSYVKDSNGNKIYVYREGDTIDFYKLAANSWEPATQLNLSPVSGSDNTSLKFSDGTITVSMDKVSYDFSQKTQVSNTTDEAKRVLFWPCTETSAVLTLDTKFEGSESDPLYIILSPSRGPKIYVGESNDRPIIFCYLGTEQLNLYVASGKTFKGMIYAPYCQLDYNNYNNGNNQAGNFYGSIVTNMLRVQNPGPHFVQHNWVRSDDTDFTPPGSVITAQKARKQAAIDYAKADSDLANIIPAEAWSNPNWYTEALNEASQEQINGQNNPKYNPNWEEELRTAWYNARLNLWKTQGLDMPDWPWTAGGKTTDKDKLHYIKDDDSSSSSSASSSGLRLINYDGEYTATNPFRALQLNENLD